MHSEYSDIDEVASYMVYLCTNMTLRRDLNWYVCYNFHMCPLGRTRVLSDSCVEQFY